METMRQHNQYGKKTKKPSKEYYEKFCVNKFDNLEDMDKFLETYSLPKLNQEETDNLNRLITRSEIESVIKKKKNSPQIIET